MTASQTHRLELLEARRNSIDRPEPTILIQIVDVVDGRPFPAEFLHWDGATGGYGPRQNQAAISCD
jgi:hypothetical protein